MLPPMRAGLVAMADARRQNLPRSGPNHTRGHGPYMGDGRSGHSSHPLSALVRTRTAPEGSRGRRRIGDPGEKEEVNQNHQNQTEPRQDLIQIERKEQDAKEEPTERGGEDIEEEKIPDPPQGHLRWVKQWQTRGIMANLIKGAKDTVKAFCSPKKRPIDELKNLNAPSLSRLPPGTISNPPITGKNRSRKGALNIARATRISRRLMTELERDFSADSSRKSKVAIRRTVRSLLKEARPKGEVVPATVERLKLLGGILKGAKYKAANIYLGEYKLMHVEAGFDWTDQLDRTLQLCKRATTRGVGPSNKAREVTTHDEGTSFTEPHKVKKAKGFVTLAKELFEFSVIWMLRRVETQKVEADHITLDGAAKKVSLHLPISKTDQRAEGVTRVLQCTCNKLPCRASCPYAIAVKLKGAAAKLGTRKLCILKSGKEATKGQLIQSWKNLYGKETSGHSARRTGALRYIKQGWTIAQVAYLGRWKSAVIYGYAAEALQLLPVNNQDTFKGWRGQGHGEGHHSSSEPESLTTSIKDRLSLEVEAMKEDQKKAFMALDAEVAAWKLKTEKENGMLPPLVQTVQSKVIHFNIRLASCSPPAAWNTACGWHYNWSGFVFLNGGEERVTCQKCIIAQGLARVHGGGSSQGSTV